MKISRCNTCLHLHSFCIKLNQLPFYKELKIPKTIMQKLPRCFEETPLGDPKGALRQFRGTQGSHVLEYKNEWVLHRDKIDPRFDPIGHLVNDAPDVLVLGSLLVALGFLGLILAIGGENK